VISRGSACRALVAVPLLLFAATAVSGAGAPYRLELCRQQIQDDPKAPAGYYCAYRYVLAGGNADEAVALLEESFRRHPRAHRAMMFVAWIDRIRGRSDWPETLGRAVEGMEATGDSFGVVYGGLMLAFRLGEEGRIAEATEMVERCARAARATGDPTMEARVWVGEGVLAVRQQDHSRDIHLLRRAEKVVFPDGPYDIRCTVMDNLGSDYWYLGRYRKAFEAFETASRLREEAHDLWWQAAVVHGMALCGMSLVEEGEMEPGDLDRLLEWGMELAITSSNGEVEAAMHVLLGRRSSGETALWHYREALEIARREGGIVTEIEAMELLGLGLAARGPEHREEAERWLLEAERRATVTGHEFARAGVLSTKAVVQTIFGPPEDAVRSHLEALDFIESLRTPAVPGAVRAQAFFHWGYAYHRLAGWLLSRTDASPESAGLRALAFSTMERYRARELLDHLESHRGRLVEVTQSEPFRRHREVLARISGVQRVLTDPDLGQQEREVRLRELGSLEEDESRLRDELERRIGSTGDPFGAGIPTLDAIQDLLAPDQALLSYQLWDGEAGAVLPLDTGRSWLILVTRDRAWSIPLASRSELRLRLEILEGLLASGPGGENEATPALVRLHGDLVGAALELLPPEVRRLVIVPDDVLFRCPFGALKASREGPFLARDFEISMVPSAGVWAHLKRRPGSAAPPQRSAALVLCTPSPGGAIPRGESHRAAGPWREGLHLEPLVHAEEEARALASVAGPGSVILSGEAASEAALKGAELDGFTILDLVTHAVVDEDQPERSAIILAPGSGEEDGLLQVREIPFLALHGQLVILSSCGSSAGPLLGGEGVQSLARAFLEAGAGAVVASLWRLEDRAAAEVLTGLARELGRGLRLSDALRRAQATARDGGMPPAGWAGLVIVGDGDIRPIPARGRPGWQVFLAGLALLAAVLASMARRSR